MTAASQSHAVRTEVSTALVFPGDGEMAQRCRAFDWSTTPLGPVSGWSQSLRTVAALVLSSQNPMFLWWGSDLVQIYNDAYRPSLGIDGRHPHALGAQGRESWTEIWSAIGPQIEQVMTTGVATWHEDQYLPIYRNGRLDDVWWTYSYSPVMDDDGLIKGTLVVCQETTARIRTESERLRLLADLSQAVGQLSASESRYRTLFNSVDEGFCVIELQFDGDEATDYKYIEANPAFIAQSGLPDPVGRFVSELIPDLEDFWVETYGKVATSGVPTRFEAPSNALHRWFDVYAFRIGEAAERKVAIIFTDISAKVQAERERESLLSQLSLERSRLSEAFRLAPSFLAIMRGSDHVFEFVNDAYYAVVGHRQLVGLPVREALPEVRGQGFIDLLDGVLKSGEPYVGRETPVELSRSDDVRETRYVDFIYQPLVESDGSRSGVVAHGSDVTEQVVARMRGERLLADSESARREAEVARAEAESANRTKSEFLAIMSHELRTPLNAIGGYAELMELGIRGPVTPLQRDDLRRLQASQRHLLGLINEVLNYAKLETGTVHYELEPVPIREALIAAESLVAPQARAKGLHLLVTECDADIAAIADVEKLRQVLVNLLSNAVKFTARGGRIMVSCETSEERVSVHVQDTGIGIPDDKLTGIFDPFVQVRTDLNRPHEGTGLGLAISRDLARGMRGDLSVESTLGSGSTFIVSLPRVV
jgi:signal transduction histidine kinase